MVHQPSWTQQGLSIEGPSTHDGVALMMRSMNQCFQNAMIGTRGFHLLMASASLIPEVMCHSLNITNNVAQAAKFGEDGIVPPPEHHHLVASHPPVGVPAAAAGRIPAVHQ